MIIIIIERLEKIFSSHSTFEVCIHSLHYYPTIWRMKNDNRLFHFKWCGRSSQRWSNDLMMEPVGYITVFNTLTAIPAEHIFFIRSDETQLDCAPNPNDELILVRMKNIVTWFHLDRTVCLFKFFRFGIRFSIIFTPLYSLPNGDRVTFEWPVRELLLFVWSIEKKMNKLIAVVENERNWNYLCIASLLPNTGIIVADHLPQNDVIFLNE